MTTIKYADYIFEVDIEKTIDYYKKHSLCDCKLCTDFYSKIKGEFPKTEEFLAGFGVDISRPDEISSIDFEDYVDYIIVDYTVCGKVDVIGENDIVIDDEQPIRISITGGYASPNEQETDYFTFSVKGLELSFKE